MGLGSGPAGGDALKWFEMVKGLRTGVHEELPAKFAEGLADVTIK